MRKRTLTLTLIALGAVAASSILAIEAHFLWPAARLVLAPGRAGSIYYLPSENMLPTLAINDRIVPLVVDGVPRRGEVIVFRGPQQVRVARVVGLPGDRVALSGGVVSIDGTNAAVRVVGTGPMLDGDATTIKAERLPGEARPHLILDAGVGVADDVAPRLVPKGNLFVLGDNRDRAADSRFAPNEGGVGMVPIDRVVGAVTATLWSSRTHKLGTPLDRIDLATAGRRS